MSKETNWFALLTRSNYENIVYDRIRQKQIEVFLPKIKTKSRRRDRHIMLERPLFPGYVFVRTSILPKDHLNILKTLGAVRILGNTTEPVPIASSQIKSLRILTGTENDVITGNSALLKQGDPVMILEGPMAGLKGEFVRYKGKNRVVIHVDALKQFAGIEVEECNVEKVPNILA